jgi:glutathione S-transferase
LAERLGPQPVLIPTDEWNRLVMFGICHELCAEDGFGWNCRLLMLDMIERAAGATLGAMQLDGMRRKFSNGMTLDQARSRIVTIMATLAKRLEAQRDDGSEYFVGQTLTAADIYWTTFSNLIVPMADADCPMPVMYRTCSAGLEPTFRNRIPAILIEHRERTLHRHFELPMSF